MYTPRTQARSIVASILILSSIGNFFLSAVAAQDTSAPSKLGVPDSLLIQVSDTEYQIGNVRIDKDRREITMPGWINMNHGLVEYFAVAPGGKTHESVLVVDIEPLHLQLALLLLGLDYGQNLSFQGDTLAPVGDSVSLSVKWLSENGDTASYEASELIWDLRTRESMPSTEWVFTGSLIYEGGLMADMEGSLVATYSDPVAILNNPLADRIDDTIYGANEELLPAQKTKIWMIIKAP